MRIKSKHKEEEEKLDIEFCIECGDDLNNFSLEEKSKDIKEVDKNFENCKQTGKFKGDICSKMFIAKDESSELYED